MKHSLHYVHADLTQKPRTMQNGADMICCHPQNARPRPRLLTRPPGSKAVRITESVCRVVLGITCCHTFRFGQCWSLLITKEFRYDQGRGFRSGPCTRSEILSRTCRTSLCHVTQQRLTCGCQFPGDTPVAYASEQIHELVEGIRLDCLRSSWPETVCLE